MNRAEFAELVELLEACWPLRPVRDDSAARWFADLKDLDAVTAKAAVLAVYRSGREFMPTGAQIRQEIAAQTIDAPPFREAWDLLLAGIRARGSHNPLKVVEYVAERNPAVAQWAGRCDIRQIGMSTEGDTTVYAQARQHYENVMAREARRITHGDLPSAAAPALIAAPTTTDAPRPASKAIGELVQSLHPDAQDNAA